MASVCISGIACRVSNSKSPEEFWALLSKEACLVTEAPSWRWVSSKTLYGCFIETIQEFDPTFFSVLPKFSKIWCPGRKLALMCAWEAMEDAGLVVEDVSSFCMFHGCSESDYSFTMNDTSIGSGNVWAHGDISWFFNLKGVSSAIDTACSSSALALSLGAREIQSGNSSGGFIAGSHTINSPWSYAYLLQEKLCSSSGRSRPFDASADGYARSEAVGVCVLVNLTKFFNSRNRCLLAGYGVSQDGRTARRFVPQSSTQLISFEKSLIMSGLKKKDIKNYEAQGTATLISDTVEANSAMTFFVEHSCVVVSALKSITGHAEPASGILGVIKTVLSIDRGAIPKLLNFSKISPHIGEKSFQSSSLIFPLETMWSKDIVVSESHFSIGGLNVNLVLRNAAPLSKEIEGSIPFAIFSGNMVHCIDLMKAQFLNYLVVSSQSLPRTLLELGRRNILPCRAVFLVETRKKLAKSLKGKRDPPLLEFKSSAVVSLELVCAGKSFADREKLEMLSKDAPAFIKRTAFSSFLICCDLLEMFKVDSVSGRGLSSLGLKAAIERNNGYSTAQMLKDGLSLNAKSRRIFELVASDGLYSLIQEERDRKSFVRDLDALACLGMRFSAWGKKDTLLTKLYKKVSAKQDSSVERIGIFVGRSRFFANDFKNFSKSIRISGSSLNDTNVARALAFSCSSLKVQKIQLKGSVPTYQFDLKQNYEIQNSVKALPQTKAASDKLKQINDSPVARCKYCEMDIVTEDAVQRMGESFHRECVVMCFCKICGDYMSKARTFTFDYEYFHKECFDKNNRCEFCHEGVKNGDDIEFNGKRLHQICLAAYRREKDRCAQCGKIVSESNKVWFNSAQLHISCLTDWRRHAQLKSSEVTILSKRKNITSKVSEAQTFFSSITQVIETTLSLDKGSLAPDVKIMDLGIDSSSFVRLRQVLGQHTRVMLPPTMIFQQPDMSIADLVKYLEDHGAVLAESLASTEVETIKDSFLMRNLWFLVPIQILLILSVLCLTLTALLVSQVFVIYVLLPVHWSLLPLTFPVSSTSLLLLHVCLKWIVIGRYKEGKFPLWSSYFIRWWFLDRLTKFIMIVVSPALTKNSIFCKIWLLALGCRLDWRCCVRGAIFEYDLVSLKKFSGVESAISCSILRPSFLELKSVVVEEGAWVGVDSVINPGNVLPTGCLLDDMSFLFKGVDDRPGQVFRGSPAKAVDGRTFSPNKSSENLVFELLRSIIQVTLHAYFLAFSMLALPVYLYNFYIQPQFGTWIAVGSLAFLIPMMIPVSSMVYVVIKWVLLWKVVPGEYKIHGFLSFRLDVIECLYGSVFRLLFMSMNYSPWLSWAYRLLGAHVKRQTIFGASLSSGLVQWDCVKIGRSCFIGPFVTLKTWRFENSKLILEQIEIGDGCSIGTQTVVQGGVSTASNVHISSCSLVSSGSNLQSGAYAGTPSSKVANLKPLGDGQGVKFFPWYDIPISIFYHILFFVTLATVAVSSYVVVTYGAAYLFSSFAPQSIFETICINWVSLCCGIASGLVGFVILSSIIHRIFCSRGRIVHHPNWNTSLINLIEGFFVNVYFPLLGGSTLLNLALSTYGSTIGSRTFIDCPFFSDFALQEISDRCTIFGSIIDPHGPVGNAWAMKYGSVKLGSRTSFERFSVVSLQASTEDGAVILGHSRLLAEEVALSNSRYIGSPAVAIPFEDLIVEELQKSASSRNTFIYLGGIGDTVAPDFLRSWSESFHNVRFLYLRPLFTRNFDAGEQLQCWFPLKSFPLKENFEDIDDFKKCFDESVKEAKSLISREFCRVKFPENLMVCGFSEGAVIAAYAGLSLRKRICKVNLVCGYLTCKYPLEISEENISTEVVSHVASDDSFVPSEQSQKLHSFLLSKSIDVKQHFWRGDHAVSEECLKHLEDQIRQLNLE